MMVLFERGAMVALLPDTHVKLTGSVSGLPGSVCNHRVKCGCLNHASIRRYQDCFALELLSDLQTAETELGGNISVNSACCSH